jgi:hypothetical protein
VVRSAAAGKSLYRGHINALKISSGAVLDAAKEHVIIIRHGETLIDLFQPRLILSSKVFQKSSSIRSIIQFFFCVLLLFAGRDSSVRIATRYVLDGLGIESRWGLDFPHLPIPPWGPPNPLKWVPGISRG